MSRTVPLRLHSGNLSPSPTHPSLDNALHPWYSVYHMVHYTSTFYQYTSIVLDVVCKHRTIRCHFPVVPRG